MSEERIVRYSVREALALRGHSDWDRVEAMTDEEILAGIKDDPDWVGLEMLDFTGAPRMEPVRKTAISIRIDDDVLAYFKSLGPGYQSRMNAVLRQFYTEFADFTLKEDARFPVKTEK